MRLTFLLDENILYHAIRGVDRHDNPDTTAAELVLAITRICHGIYVHQFLLDAYNAALRNLREYPPRSLLALFLVKQLLHNSLKRGYIETCPLPDLPAGVEVPREDIDIVRAALIAKPTLVTNDSELEISVEVNREALEFRAMDAAAALELARSEKP